MLVVDDHAESRRLLMELLSSAGFDVRGAANGNEAVSVWDAWRPRFIWMDMNMPVEDGYQATRRIIDRDLSRQTVIVALTASVFEEDRKQIFSCGCVDVIGKPFRERDVFSCLAKHLGVEYERERAVAVLPEAENIAEKIHALPKDVVARIRQCTRTLDGLILADIANALTQEHPAVAQFLMRSAEQLDFKALHQIMSDKEDPI